MNPLYKNKILRNRAVCLRCNTEIESKSTHDFVTCKCGNLSVDGGLDYIKRGCVIVEEDGKSTYRDTSVTMGEYSDMPKVTTKEVEKEVLSKLADMKQNKKTKLYESYSYYGCEIDTMNDGTFIVTHYDENKKLTDSIPVCNLSGAYRVAKLLYVSSKIYNLMENLDFPRTE